MVLWPSRAAHAIEGKKITASPRYFIARWRILTSFHDENNAHHYAHGQPINNINVIDFHSCACATRPMLYLSRRLRRRLTLACVGRHTQHAVCNLCCNMEHLCFRNCIFFAAAFMPFVNLKGRTIGRSLIWLKWWKQLKTRLITASPWFSEIWWVKNIRWVYTQGAAWTFSEPWNSVVNTPISTTRVETLDM